MADLGAVVMPTQAPSVGQQQDDPTTDRTTLPHKTTTTVTSSPLQPINETNQQYTSNITTNNHISAFDNLETTKPVTAQTAANLIDAPQESNTDKKQIESKPTVDLANNQTNSLANSCSSSQPLASVVMAKKKAKYEETIIDGFAICAFKSWEDLQDELNERIASEKANKDNAPSEKSSSEPIKKKKKSKHKEIASINSSRNETGSFSQTKVSKSKTVKRDKKVSGEKASKKKKSDEHSAGSAARTTDKKQKVSNGLLVDGPTTTPGPDTRMPSKPNSGSNQSGSATDHHNSPHTSSSPKVHHSRESNSISNKNVNQQEPKSSHKVQHYESQRRPEQSQGEQFPYGHTPHPQRSVYETTSKNCHHLHDSCHQNAHNRLNQPEAKPNSQPKQHIDEKQTGTNQHAIPQTGRPPQSQMPYHQNAAPMYSSHPSHSSPSASHPHCSHSMHHRQPNPYFYPPMSTNPHSSAMPPLPPHLCHHYQAQQSYNYPSPYLQPNQPPYYQPHDNRNSHMAHPSNMYPPQPPYQQHPHHSSSIVSSIKMSALPAPYGSPYIITDTTISRQTSVVPPPMPTALEQAAASSVASRFGHHPSTIHSMNHYNAAAAAAAAATAAQTPTQPSSMYSTPQISPEKSFFELAARNYNSSHPAAPGYPAFPPPASYAHNPYGFDRWPRAAVDQHAVANYNNFYQAGNSLLTDRPGPLAARGPSFPAGMFPPPPF